MNEQGRVFGPYEHDGPYRTPKQAGGLPEVVREPNRAEWAAFCAEVGRLQHRSMRPLNVGVGRG